MNVSQFVCVSMFMQLPFTITSRITISGTVVYETNVVQPYVNVLLINPSDSILVRGTLAEEDGEFIIEQVTPGTYILLTRSVGLTSARTNLTGQNIETAGSFDFSRPTVRLTYSRNFGNSKLRASRNRKTGSEEERQRVN